MTLEEIEQALLESDWEDIELSEEGITAWTQGFHLHAEILVAPKEILSEERCGFNFPVFCKCYIREKWAENDHAFVSFLENLAKISKGEFLVSFQYETVFFWRGSDGLQKRA